MHRFHLYMESCKNVPEVYEWEVGFCTGEIKPPGYNNPHLASGTAPSIEACFDDAMEYVNKIMKGNDDGNI